jgi:hypothetical protein
VSADDVSASICACQPWPNKSAALQLKPTCWPAEGAALRNISSAVIAQFQRAACYDREHRYKQSFFKNEPLGERRFESQRPPRTTQTAPASSSLGTLGRLAGRPAAARWPAAGFLTTGNKQWTCGWSGRQLLPLMNGAGHRWFDCDGRLHTVSNIRKRSATWSILLG